MNKKWFTLSNASTAILLVFVILMIVNPSVKGVVIQGLMKIGLFQPDVSAKNEKEPISKISQGEKSGVLFKDEAGNVISLSDLKGKVVFINFWATWCPPCIAEMPSINKLQDKFKDNKNIVILMVDADNQPEKSKKFMIKHHYDLKIYTPASEIPTEFLDSALPTTVVLNKKGEIVFKHEGGADYTNQEFINFFETLSKE
jgi:thiol-disulfide isomerase/thioredoxin